VGSGTKGLGAEGVSHVCLVNRRFGALKQVAELSERVSASHLTPCLSRVFSLLVTPPQLFVRVLEEVSLSFPPLRRAGSRGLV
jgi:hypothetical protein